MFGTGLWVCSLAVPNPKKEELCTKILSSEMFIGSRHYKIDSITALMQHRTEGCMGSRKQSGQSSFGQIISALENSEKDQYTLIEQ